MVKDFKTKNGGGWICTSKKPMGIGFHIDFNPPIAMIEKQFECIIDLLWIRFIWTTYKNHNSLGRAL